jgi:hypothetical protein
MKLDSVDIAELPRDARPRLSTEIEGGGRTVSFRYEGAPQSDRIAFSSSEELSHEGDAALLLGLLPAMKLGLPIRVPWEVSPRLVGGLTQAQHVFRYWYSDLEAVAIEAEPGPMSEARGDRVGAFFSGGVDSFYTALKYGDEITDLIHVTGFDLPLSIHPELHERVRATAREVAAELGKNLIEIRADLRPFCYEYVPWGLYNGLALAGIASLLQHRFRAVHLPAGWSFSVIDDGQTPHPLTDPLLSTDLTQIVCSGVETDRIDKIAYLANSELAMKHLRVCWEVPDGEYNCGACKKCLSTMIGLYLAGALGKCETLPDRVGPAEYRHLKVLPGASSVHTEENLRALEARGGNRPLVRAVRAAMRRGEREERRKDQGS